MKAVFANVSNHPSSGWSEEQRRAALEIATVVALHNDPELKSVEAEIVDVPFPNVPPHFSSLEILPLAVEVVRAIPSNTTVAMVQGEFVLSYMLVRQLQKKGITVVAATSERKTVDLGNGRKATEFQFVRFRVYPEL